MSLRGHRTAAASGAQTVRFLVALIGPAHIAFPAHWIRGILTLVEAGPVEFLTWGDISYERTDLAGRLTIASEIPTTDTRIILYSNDQRFCSFMVDRVLGLVDVERMQIQALPLQFRGGERVRLLGFFADTAYVALIANPFWVLEIPPPKNVLDAFVLQTPERRGEECDARPHLPSIAFEDAVLSAAHVK